MATPDQFPHTQREVRQKEKREGPNGKPGKAGRVQGKSRGSNSHKESGGKGAR